MAEGGKATIWDRVAASPALRIGLFICILLVTAGLVYYAYIAGPVQIADVVPQLTIQSGVSAVNIQAAGPIENGQLPWVINGTLNDPSADSLAIITAEPGSAVDQEEANCCVISGNTFVGTSQIGTPASPLTGGSVVAFRLIASGTGTVEAAGTLTIDIESLPGSGSKLAIDIIAALSLIATLIQIGQWLPSAQSRTKEAAHAPQP